MIDNTLLKATANLLQFKYINSSKLFLKSEDTRQFMITEFDKLKEANTELAMYKFDDVKMYFTFKGIRDSLELPQIVDNTASSVPTSSYNWIFWVLHVLAIFFMFPALFITIPLHVINSYQENHPK